MLPVEPEIVIPADVAEATRGTGPALFAFHHADVLGTRLELRINASDRDAALSAAQHAHSEILRLSRVFNWRDEGSELSRLNANERHQASPDLFSVIAMAERWRTLSHGGYSPRLGLLLREWRVAGALPERERMAALAAEVMAAKIELDAASRAIVRPAEVKFDLDGIAKGYIVDRALQAVMSSAGVTGAMLDIGGDIGARGDAPEEAGWRVGLPDPLLPFENAPLLGRLALSNRAIATSGCGPRDRKVAGRTMGSTLDPRTGWPVEHRRAATAIANTAMEADALATAMLVLARDEALACVEEMPGAMARIAQPGMSSWLTGRLQPAPIRWEPFAPQASRQKQQPGPVWTPGWIANITFSAPPKNMRVERAFRSPYVAIWISDAEDQPIRTLMLIGSIKEWQEDNYIWWGLNRSNTQKMLDGRSMSTRGSGTYKVYWDGSNDDGLQMPAGKYIVHVETSRERGKHTHRTLDLDLSNPKQFETELPVDVDGGSLQVEFRKFG